MRDLIVTENIALDGVAQHAPRGSAPGGRRAVVVSYSGTSHTTDNGGSVSSAECGWPCHGTGSASTPP